VIHYLCNELASLAQHRRAVTAIEYALIAALIAVSIVSAVSSMGTSIAGTFNGVTSEL